MWRKKENFRKRIVKHQNHLFVFLHCRSNKTLSIEQASESQRNYATIQLKQTKCETELGNWSINRYVEERFVKFVTIYIATNSSSWLYLNSMQFVNCKMARWWAREKKKKKKTHKYYDSFCEPLTEAGRNCHSAPSDRSCSKHWYCFDREWFLATVQKN